MKTLLFGKVLDMRRGFRTWSALGALLLFPLSGCQLTPPPRTIAWDELPREAQRTQLVSDAQNLLHARTFVVSDRTFPFDCSGFVAAVLYRSGIDVYGGASELQIRGNGVRLLYQYMSRYGRLFEEGDPAPAISSFFPTRTI
jgi:hypothetical protein